MTTNTTTKTAADKIADKIKTRIGRKLKHGARFSSDEYAGATPLALRHPHTRAAWKRMPEADRLAHIRSVIEVEVRAALEAEATARAEEAPAPAKPGPVGRYLVACIGCGDFVPASSAKPVVVRCGDAEHRGASAKAAPRLASRGELSTFDLMERYRVEAEEARAQSGESPAKKAAAKRKKRKATCPNLPKPNADLV